MESADEEEAVDSSDEEGAHLPQAVIDSSDDEGSAQPHLAKPAPPKSTVSTAKRKAPEPVQPFSESMCAAAYAIVPQGCVTVGDVLGAHFDVYAGAESWWAGQVFTVKKERGQMWAHAEFSDGSAWVPLAPEKRGATWVKLIML